MGMYVAVVTVGDEILAGDTVNTNAAWLGKQLDERGVNVERIIVVPDRVKDIARVVNETRAEYDAVIVTGGLGPTHDDVTIEGVAAAVGLQIEPSTDAISWFDGNPEYESDELVAGTTDLPQGARMLPNEEGVAPGAVVKPADGVPIYILPGVPEEMKAMFRAIADEFTGARRERTFIITSERESALLDRFEAVQDRFDVAIGSYPGGDVVRIKIEGSGAEEVQQAASWLRERVAAGPDEHLEE